MTSINEHTHDRMMTKPATKEYETNWEVIFGKKKKEKSEQSEQRTTEGREACLIL